MADVTVTAADVRPLPGAVVRRFGAGGALNAGDAVYVAADGDVEAADADAAASARIIGLVVAGPDGKTAYVAGDRVDVVVFGPVAGFSSLAEENLLFASINAGALADTAPAGASGDYVWVAGWPVSPVIAFINPFTYDVAAQ